MSALRIISAPDFARFRDVLLLKRAVKRPPLFDFHIAPAHKSAVLGRPYEGPRDDAEFFRFAGYDYVQMTFGIPHTELIEAEHAEQQRQATQTRGIHSRVIQSYEHFRSRRWSWFDAAEGNLAAVTDRLQCLENLAKLDLHGMKIMYHTADIFTLAWMMIGFDEFCLASVEQPEYIDAVMGSLAQAAENITRRAIEIAGNEIGVFLYSDDIAYTEGLMLSPEFFRKHLFPAMGRLTALLAKIDAPTIYHSDGRLFQVFDDLAAIGIRGIQPLEPKSMDPLEIKRNWPGKFCLAGNIDLDLMCRGTPEQVEAHVREKIDRLNVNGGYMPGVSNTVPFYVKTENYLRMIETVYSYTL
ncbi:MAG: hypothetical protein FWD61_04805 [Phycisphaerales bacterium]|nr:hypothetical protein [Phycisphaerales bacterium]